MDKAAKPLKIFISYGHEIDALDENGNPYPNPNNESVVRKIKAYLESRGHEVWLDREKIKEGSDWRKAIYDGVEWSDVALICLSRKAMKPNGVCRDEISIALGVRGGNMFPVKLEALEDSEYPAYLLNRQLFTRFMDWRSHWTEDSIDEAWLDQNLEELAKALEDKDVWRFGEEMVELKKLLKPWNMNDRLRQLDRGVQTLYNEKTKEFENKTVHKFCGRESLFKLFEGKIAQSGQAVRVESDRVLWLKKGPGFGKSRFAAELLYRYYYAISAAYFIVYNQRVSLDPTTFVKSVAYQLAQANSAYRKKLLNYLKENPDELNRLADDPHTLFKTLVVDLLSDEIDGGRATQWILVDALDEATESNRNEITELISQNLDRLPPWISFFITSRDKDNVVNRNFSQFTPIDFSEEENVGDVRDYILNEFNGMNITVSEELVNALQEKSEGTFLYPEMVFRDLKKNSFTIDDIRDLPSGVIGYIHKQFDRLFGKDLDDYENEVRPMLGFILTSCEPISRAVLKYCLGISRSSEFDKRLKALGTFFIQSGSTDEDTVVPFHKSVIDYCFDQDCSGDYYVYPDEAKEDFANRGLEQYKSGALQWMTRTDEKPDIVQRYFLNWLPSHLMNANITKEAASVLSDFAFLMKRLRYGNVERVLLDYILFRHALKGVSKDSDAYFDVICSNTHFLRRNSEDNPAFKIILQITTEVADDCPVTQAAEQWLNPETGDSPCDWFWLNKVNRPKEYQPNPCKLVMENAGHHVKLLSNGDVLSWGTDDRNLRIWDLETGVCKAVLEGHTCIIKGAIELRSGDILSWNSCHSYRLWSQDGICKAIIESDRRIAGAIALFSDNILSWSNNKTFSLWSIDGKHKTFFKGHTKWVSGVLELHSRDILSWAKDKTMRLWSPDGRCKAVFEGYTSSVCGAIELCSGDILSWGGDTLQITSLDGTCKAIMKGHKDLVMRAIELRSGNILSWSRDYTMYLWSQDGMLISTLAGNTFKINGAIELHSGNILSWSEEKILRLWSPDGKCIAVLDGHLAEVNGAIELHNGDILSWSGDETLRIWTLNGTFKSILDEPKSYIEGTTEPRSSDNLSWSYDRDFRLCSPDGTSKLIMDSSADIVDGSIKNNTNDNLIHQEKSFNYDSHDRVLKESRKREKKKNKVYLVLSSGDILLWYKGYLNLLASNGAYKTKLWGHDYVVNVIELSSGNILSLDLNKTIRLWTPDGKLKEVINPQKPHFDSYFALFHKERVHERFYAKQTNWGIELQHDFKPITRWNSPSCRSFFVGDGRIWYGDNGFDLEFLQLNYGNHMSVSFEQAHQLLAGEINESKLVTYVPESKGMEDSKTE
ncbi:MAG: TIR domain-containing protein [Thermoguttaceae bacterium]|nr:TIR domain-containing protein [Thermoguttaceae bacterium]